MKLSAFPSSFRRRGMALVMVVLMLALMLTLMLAVYSMSGSELKGANRYASGQQVRQFGDLAVDVAIAQLRKGTTPNADNIGREVWTSQPGLIRQHDASGDLLAAYKLYSSSQMVVNGGTDAEASLLNDTPPTNWQDLKARYVDLNRPIHRIDTTGTTSLHFPIIDPRAMTGQPDAVSGFSYSDKLTNGRTVTGVKTTGGDTQRLPMPVEWLYLLRDGTLGTLDLQNKFIAAVAPTVDNPIVGRIAFWADDESSKVNVNTASEPTPWAVPTFFHEDDARYAKYQPVNGEFQRYPGHPATTALSPILFPDRLLTTKADQDTIDDKNLIYGLTPKIGTGGTKGGTVSSQDPSIARIKLASFRKERLYASLDEYLLKEDRTQNDFGQGKGVDATNVLQRKGFFLTAQSRSPELNLHGLPKIALWPINYRGTDYGTSFDQLVAFCTTLRQTSGGGLRKYIFQRGYADSPTQDIQRPENLALLSYLYNLLQNPMPGFAAVPSQNFSAKYGDDLQQILVEIFDYVRSTNLYDGNLIQNKPSGNVAQNYLLGYATGSTRDFSFKTFTDFRQYGTAADDNVDADPSGTVEMLGNPGHGQVTPSQWKVGTNTFQGIGRFPTVSEVGLHFICAADNTNDDANDYKELDPNIGKPGGGSAPTMNGTTPQARWYSNFPPVPAPNPVRNEPADNTKWKFTGGFPYGPDKTHPGYQSVNWNFQLNKNTWLPPGTRRIQSRLLLEFFVPAAGYTLIEPEFTVRVSGLLKFRVNGQQLFLNDTEVFYTGRRASNTGSQLTGGYGIGLKGVLRGREAIARAPMIADNNWGGGGTGPEWKVKPASSAGDESCVLNYNLLSKFIDVDVGRKGDGTMNFSQADLKIEVYSGHIGRIPVSGDSQAVLVQTLTPSFPAAPTMPAPTLVRQFNNAMTDARDKTEAPAWWTFYSHGALGFSGLTKAQETAIRNDASGFYSTLLKNTTAPLRGRLFRDNVSPVRTGSQPSRSAFFFGFDAEDSAVSLFKPQVSSTVADAELNEGSDVVQTVTIRHGDYRLTAAMPVVDASQWKEHRYYGLRRLAHSFSNFVSNQLPGYDYGSKSDFASRLTATKTGATYPAHRIPDLPYLAEATTAAQLYGDFDNGPGPARDGPYINKPDEGNTNNVASGGVPYLSESNQHTTADADFFTPNRLVPSPGILGSLPTGVKSGKPWRTLQFRPQQDHPGGPSKLGGTNPPDHLLLEYFWMPIVEPYAISEPFSTAGKINLNYQILPFTNIRRASGLHALFASERITAVPTSDAPNYKVFPDSTKQDTLWKTSDGYRWHYNIDAEKTLAQFEQRFKAGKTFLSASEICDVHLVPDRDVADYTQMENFWSTRRLTGDNSRERPYTNLYPRITTRSNTYRVHYIAQIIRKARSAPVNTITDADTFESEYRGSAVVDRFLDPAQASLPDFTTVTTASPESLDNYYQFRVLEKRKFGN